MYRLSEQDRLAVLGMELSDRGVSRADLDAHETLVEACLPVIPGLAAAESEAERQQVFSTAVAIDRERFVARFGSPFGTAELGMSQVAHEKQAAAGSQTIVFHLESAA